MHEKLADLSKENLLKIITEQNSKIINLDNKIKNFNKYGLIWDREKEPEKVVVDCETNIPILKIDNSKTIVSNNSDDNILIEGDNYHALTVLNYTHKEKIDVIYIDPPYNTGHKNEWKYNDECVDKNDNYKHSKWLNMMDKRLSLAKNLLKDSGIIFISIDDHEQANLKLLCDKIFEEHNHIATLPTVMNLKGNNDQFGFAGTHEYTLVYMKNKNLGIIREYALDDEDLSDWDEDEIGLYKKGAPLRATGEESDREHRPQMFYPLLFNCKTKSISTIDQTEYEKIYHKTEKYFDDNYITKLRKKYESKGLFFILPQTEDGKYGRWRWGWSQCTIEKLKTEVMVLENNNRRISLYKKQRPEISDLPTRKPKTLFYKPVYSSGNGTAQLKNIFGEKVFNNPKPLDLIYDFIDIGGDKNSTILDFTAGSGTTGHAVLKINQNDNGTRKFILCTNNENKICEDVCYPRLKKVIEGYKNINGTKIEGLGGNLKYFKTDLISVERIDKVNDKKRMELTKKAGDMIGFKEATLELLELNDFYQIFTNKEKTKFTAIYFREDEERFIELLKKINKKKSVLYIFSYGKIDRKMYKNLEKNISIEDIPQPILDIYREINLKIEDK